MKLARRSFLVGSAASALIVSRKVWATPFSTAFGYLSVKDPTFGARGDGTGNDGPAIQACFDAAFGPMGSPHGTPNRFLNRDVIMPPGAYNIGAPLYLTNVVGARIIGGGMNNTRLQYTGSFSGNTWNGNGITPLLMFNGVSYSTFQDFDIYIANSNAAGLYIYQDGTHGGTNQNEFRNILFESATAGALIGYQSNGLCSEQVFFDCLATGCVYGWRNIASNALNNNCYNCSTASCTTAGWSFPTGAMNIIGGGSAQNAVDISTGQNAFTVVGFRTESANFIDMTGSVTQGVVSGCIQASGAGAGNFINLGGGKAIIDGCTQESATGTDGLILGTSGSKVYLRGNDFRNASYLGGFLGTVAQNI